MKIVADSNIPFAPEAFAGLADVEVLKASEMSPERLRDCEVLLCRSTRNVDAAMLDGTKVRFVATATIGTDHVDLDYLARRGIAFASAPGSNANSVSEYVTAALLTLAGEMGRPLREMTVAVIGVGNVGRRVVEKAQALGMRVLLNDPPLARQTGDSRFRPLDELLGADVITLHVPLTTTGPDATYHMVGDLFVERMKDGAIFINSARGAVVDSAALHKMIDSGKVTAVVLDTWENEPMIDPKLLAKVAIGTPHIAGHSFDGKVNGTKMVYDAACRFLHVPPTWTPEAAMPPPDVPKVSVSAAGRDDEDVIREAVLAVYDVLKDDEDLRQMPSDERRGEYFNALRRNYRPRREFRNTLVEVKGGSHELRRTLAGLGFEADQVVGDRA